MNSIFRGAGCNGSTVLSAITRAIESPSSETVPAGATWPFAALNFEDRAVRFSMLHIQRTVSPSDVKQVILGKNGYIFFRLKDKTKDFGIATLQMGAVMEQLQTLGFTLDRSCRKNLPIAKLMLTIFTVVPILVMVLVVTLSILRPNGI